MDAVGKRRGNEGLTGDSERVEGPGCKVKKLRDCSSLNESHFSFLAVRKGEAEEK